MPKDPESGRYYTDDEYKRLQQRRSSRARIGEATKKRVEARKAEGKRGAYSKKEVEQMRESKRRRQERESQGYKPPVTGGKPKKPKKPEAQLPPSSQRLIDTLQHPFREGVRRIRGG